MEKLLDNKILTTSASECVGEENTRLKFDEGKSSNLGLWRATIAIYFYICSVPEDEQEEAAEKEGGERQVEIHSTHIIWIHVYQVVRGLNSSIIYC